MSSLSPRSKAVQACQACRGLKVKCLPGSQLGLCSKCERAGLTCTWAEYRPRVRRKKIGSKARIAALESKLDQLLAGVTESQPPKYAEHAGYPSPPASASQARHGSTPGTTESALVDEHDDMIIDLRDALNDDSLTEFLAEHQMSMDEAERYLAQYREMTLYFPFVVLPANSSVSSLSQERPMLLLAILAAGSSSNRDMQMSIEKTLRVTLLERIMLEGEKDLDLLAALLVYLAWHHFYYIPTRDASSQLIHLAISLCYDLGLHLQPEEAVAIKACMNLQHYLKAQERDAQHDHFFSREARRLLLGCYYLSSNASWTRAKHNALPYTPYMTACATSLSQENEYPTDSAILPLVQFQHIAEDYYEIVKEARGPMRTTTSTAQLREHLKTVQVLLQTAQSSMPVVLRTSTFIELGFHHAVLHTHEMGLINPFADKKQTPPVAPSDKADAAILAPVRLEVIRRCLDGARDFFHSFLTIPASEYPLLSFVQWHGLIHATVVLYKLSFGLDSVPEWDPDEARKSVPLQAFLELCCQRMSAATSDAESKRSTPKRDLFSLMEPIWRNVKDTYDVRRQMPDTESRKNWDQVHAATLAAAKAKSQNTTSYTSSSNLFKHRCPAYSFWSKRDS